MAHAEDTNVKGFLPPGHVDRGGDIYGYPIPGHCQVGNCGIECVTFPEGVLGKATLAKAEKAYESIEKVCDYLEKLISDLLGVFPVGKLPAGDLMSQRGKEEIDALLKGPLNGGKHLYTIAWPS